MTVSGAIITSDPELAADSTSNEIQGGQTTIISSSGDNICRDK